MSVDSAKLRGELLGKPPSPRELQIWEMIAHGKSRLQIAAALGIAPGTVQAERWRLGMKLGQPSHTELIARYWQARSMCELKSGPNKS